MPFLIWYSLRFGVSAAADVPEGAAAVRRDDLGPAGERRRGTASSAPSPRRSRERAVRGRTARNCSSATCGRPRAGPSPIRSRCSSPASASRRSSGSAAHQVITGAITVGTLVAFHRYITLLNEPVRWLGLIVNRIARAIASGERIFETLDTQADDHRPPGALDAAPDAGDVAFRGCLVPLPRSEARRPRGGLLHRSGRHSRPPSSARPARQEHDRQPPAALLRRDPRAGPDRRP